LGEKGSEMSILSLRMPPEAFELDDVQATAHRIDLELPTDGGRTPPNDEEMRHSTRWWGGGRAPMKAKHGRGGERGGAEICRPSLGGTGSGRARLAAPLHALRRFGAHHSLVPGIADVMTRTDAFQNREIFRRRRSDRRSPPHA
jgi:hypothetical protein